MATLQEIDHHYTYLDVVMANEALDIQAEAEYLTERELERRRQAQQPR